MVKAACLLTGENFQVLKTETPASKKKVVAMSIAMLVPTLIWVFNGFMLSFCVLQAGMGWALLTAIVCGTIVFFIEKLIIMANGNRWLTFFRISIGLMVAILGSIAIDEVVFKRDINNSVSELKQNAIRNAQNKAEKEFNLLNHMEELIVDIGTAQEKYDNAVDKAVSEADGSSGSGNKGVGIITQFKNKIAQKRKEELDVLLVRKQNLDRLKDSLILAAENVTATNFDEYALLTRIRALFRLVVKDRYMSGTYLLFTFLMFFFEFLVVILKLTWKKTNYERKVEMIEEIGKKRMEFLQNQGSPLLDPGVYLPQLEKTRDLLKKKNSLYN